MLLAVFLPIHTFNLVHKHRQRLDSVRFKEKFSTLIVDLDTRRPLAFHFYSIFFFRRIIFVLALVVLTAFPRF